MLIDRTIQGMMKKNKVVVGFDLGNDYSQISYCRHNQSMPDTVSLVMGEEQYNIPTVLCRRHGADEASAWSVGNEALKNAGEGAGTLVEDLVAIDDHSEAGAHHNDRRSVHPSVLESELSTELEKGMLSGLVGRNDNFALVFIIHVSRDNGGRVHGIRDDLADGLIPLRGDELLLAVVLFAHVVETATLMAGVDNAADDDCDACSKPDLRGVLGGEELDFLNGEFHKYQSFLLLGKCQYEL